MHITEVKPSERKKGRFLVKLADGALLRVGEEDIFRFGLRPGLDLNEEALEALRSSAKTSEAKAQAAAIIGSRALSKRELQRRLVKKGAGEPDAQAAADWLEDIGAVDDGQYAAMVARHYAARGYGPAKIRDELYRRGVDKSLWDGALEELPPAGEALDALIRKKARGDLSDPREVKRVSDALLRRGFSWPQVRDALRRYIEIEEE